MNRDREVVWRADIEGLRDAHRLENGNILILAKERIVKLDPEGRELFSKDGITGMDYGSVVR